MIRRPLSETPTIDPRRLACWLAVLIVLAHAVPAAAQHRQQVTLRLDAVARTTPEAVCFVMPGYTPGAMTWGAFHGAMVGTNTAEAYGDAAKLADARCKSLVSGGAACSESATKTLASLAKAAEILRKQPTYPCKTPAGSQASVNARDPSEWLENSCKPVFPKPEETVSDGSRHAAQGVSKDWFVTCAHDPMRSTNALVVLERVALIALYAPDSVKRGGLKHVGIESAALNLENASLTLTGLLDSGDYLIGRVLGGSYQAGIETALSGDGGAMALELVPLCAPYEVRLGALGQYSETTAVATLMSKGLSCPMEATIDQGRATIVLPWSEGSYAFEIQPEGALEPMPATTVDTSTWTSDAFQKAWTLSGKSYRGAWSGGETAPEIELHRSTVAFTWSPGCRYPLLPEGDWCPKATLGDRAGTCRTVPAPANVESRASLCHYICTADSGSSLALPIQIFMHGHPGQNLWSDETWVEPLLHPHQALQGHVSSEERRLLIRSACDGGIDGAVDHLRIYAAGRQVGTIAACTDSVVQIPGATCNQEVTAEYVGRRDFEPAIEVLTAGVLTVDPPESLVKRNSFGVVFHAGVSGMLVEPKQDFPDKPWVYGGAYYSHRPWLSDITFELQAGALFKRRWYLVSADDRDLPEEQERRSWYFTVPVEAGAIYHFNHRFALGLTAGLGIGHPLDSSDETLVGDYAASLIGSISGRLVLSTEVQFEVVGRGAFFEQASAHTLDFRGQPHVQTYGAWSGFLGLGVRWRALAF